MSIEKRYLKKEKQTLTETYYLKVTEGMKDRIMSVSQHFEFPTWIRKVIEAELPKIEKEIEKLD